MNEIWIWVLALGGAAIGVLGGLIGTYVSLRNTQGPRERGFVMRAAGLCWLLVIAFLAGLFLIPTWHRHLLWVPYSILLMLWIRWCHGGQTRIRHEESRIANPRPGAP